MENSKTLAEINRTTAEKVSPIGSRIIWAVSIVLEGFRKGHASRTDLLRKEKNIAIQKIISLRV